MNDRQSTRQSTKQSHTKTSSGDGRAKFFRTRIDLPSETREEMVMFLNQSMADLFDLYSQTKHAHWNVKGKDFYQLHLLFDEIAEEVFPFIDLVAERITALGGEAKGTIRMAAETSQVDSFPEGTFEGMEIVKILAERYARVGANAREGIDKAEEAKDMATSDLLIDVTKVLDKSLYFLEAHLQG